MSKTGPRSNVRDLRAARQEEWLRLERLLALAERKSPKALSDDDLMALPILYRGALSSLSVARETSLDLELVSYLESLCARAYFFVYGVRSSVWRRLQLFFVRDWPDAVRSLWRETCVSVLLVLVGLISAYLLIASDSFWYDAFVPAELADGRDFSASKEDLRATLYNSEGTDWLGIFAAFLFTHNSQVAIFSFALGFAFGVPTSMLLIYNGGMVGAFFALFISRGLGMELGGWLMIHGTTEFFAIILAGAAGLKIGWSVVFPGELSRLSSATIAGRSAAICMTGVVIMLFVAGILEGFGRQLITDDLARYTIGSVMLFVWLAYFYVPRGSKHA